MTYYDVYVVQSKDGVEKHAERIAGHTIPGEAHITANNMRRSWGCLEKTDANGVDWAVEIRVVHE